MGLFTFLQNTQRNLTRHHFFHICSPLSSFVLLFQPSSSSFILLIHVMFKQETRLQFYPADGSFQHKITSCASPNYSFPRRSLTNAVNSKLTPILYLFIYIQSVSGGIVNILGGGSMDYSELISSYKHVSNFQWVLRYSCLKLARMD